MLRSNNQPIYQAEIALWDDTALEKDWYICMYCATEIAYGRGNIHKTALKR